VACALALGTTTFLQTWTWRDTRALAANGLSVNPRSFAAMDMLAWTAFDDSKNHLAEKYSRESLALRPHNTTALINLGRALALQARPREAIEPLMLAVELRPGDVEAHANLAAALYAAGQFREALRECEIALELNPRHRPAQTILQWVRQALRSAPATNRSPS
jgi:tetratricopeptide (TPR) repeat protein